MENQQNKTCETALLALRGEIDAIDNQIISLLNQRMQVISKVGELKKNHQEKFFIRSNREADMIKELVKKSGDSFSKSAIVSIWRKIITNANMHEQELNIVIHNPRNIAQYTYLVKEYYNDIVPLRTHDSASNVILEVENGESQIAVFALPQSDHEEQNKTEDAKENWWIALAGNRQGLKIYAKIPFCEFADAEKNHDQIHLVAVAAKNAEKSSDDNSLIYVEVTKETSRTQVLSALKEQGFQAKILKSVKLNQVEGVVFYLIELAGFFEENDAAIKNFSKSKIKPYVKVLGNYATPVMV